MSVYLFLHSKSTIGIDTTVTNNLLVILVQIQTCQCSLTDGAKA